MVVLMVTFGIFLTPYCCKIEIVSFSEIMVFGRFFLKKVAKVRRSFLLCQLYIFLKKINFKMI